MPGHADSCRWVAARSPDCHGVGRALPAAPCGRSGCCAGRSSRRRRGVEPAGDVFAIESVEADGAEVAGDALGRPLVLQPGLIDDVDAARRPLVDELADGAALATELTRCRRIDAAALRAARCEV